MSESLGSKFKKYVAFIIICFFLGFGSYLTVYKLSFLSNSYDIVVHQEDTVEVKSFDIFGNEEKTETYSFHADDLWKMDELILAVDRQKEFLWLLYFVLSVSGFVIIYRVNKEMKLWKAILGNNLIFALLFPMVSIIYAWNRIRDLVSTFGS